MQGFCMAPFMQGCVTGAGLIIAIGAQNAFVLKQGIMRNHVFATALTCFLADSILISLGVGGFGRLIISNPLLLAIARWGGVAFLLYYGLRSFRAVFKSSSFNADEGPERPNLRQTILTIMVVSFLNPHAYLDAVVLLGCVGSQFPGNERLFFGMGAIVASLVWFFSISYGARYLASCFKKPLAWKILDFLVGCIMWGIALSLIFWAPSATVCVTS